MTVQRLVARTPVGASAARLADWLRQPAAALRLCAPWARATNSAGLAPERRVVSAGPEQSILEERVTCRRGAGPGLARSLAWRHRRIAGDLERHAAWAARPRLTVAISGATGLVGSALGAFLAASGHRVVRLTRGAAVEEGAIAWDPERAWVDRSRLEGLDAVVHLAGAGIAAGRFGAAHRARVRDSRVVGTRVLADALRGLARPPAVFVAASAVGYYGDRGAETLDETSAPGAGFLAATCQEWEAASDAAACAGVRVVRPRIGVVLAAGGGALARMLPAFRAGLGGPVGGGRQFVSWIALDDLLGVLHAALFDPGLEGPVNAVAPVPVTQGDFARTLGRVLGRPAWLPLPAPAVRIAFGRMGRELLLASARVRPVRLEALGFRFQAGDLETALRFELGRIEAGATATRIEVE